MKSLYMVGVVATIAVVVIPQTSFAVTNVKTIRNNSSQTVTVINWENPADNMSVPPNTWVSTGGIWISWDPVKPLSVTTSSGTCQFVDRNWKLLRRCDSDAVWYNVAHAGGEPTMTVNSDGTISWPKHYDVGPE
jgi:hypothetical protein